VHVRSPGFGNSQANINRTSRHVVAHDRNFRPPFEYGPDSPTSFGELSPIFYGWTGVDNN
jgi:hypothetical protein